MRSRAQSGESKRVAAKSKSLAPRRSLTQATRIRIIVVWGILMLGGLGLTLRLFYLQILQGPELQTRAREQQVVATQPFVPRRPIVDRTGNVLAIDRPVYTLYAHPKLFKADQTAIAAQLAPILNTTPGQLINQFSTAESGIQIDQSLPSDYANRITALQIDGLELVQYQQRFYPQQDLFANVVGYVNVDRQGQEGVEYRWQDLLERSVQTLRLRRDGNGSVIPDQQPGGFQHQDDLRLQLTLDSRLQRMARYALAQQLERFKAKRGTVLVMDVRDGSLVTLVSEPAYDPNEFYRFDLERLKNWALSDLYEPGSTFKPINVAIALEQGAIQPNSTFNDEGRIEVGGWPIENSDYDTQGGRGMIPITDIVKYSSNVGMVRMMQQLERPVYYEWLQRLGLGELTGIDLPFESSGQIKSPEEFNDSVVEAATTSFGQGFSLTPIQLLQLHGVLASGGKLLTPHVVEGVFDSEGKLYWQPEPEPETRIFSPQNTRTVLEMMEAAVQEGTGKAAQIPGYRIAGKTGTAQKASPYGGYESGARITSFVSIFPVEAPRYAVLVVVDEPQGDDAYGSTVAAPVAKTVMEALISIEGIPPSQPIEDSPGEEDEGE